MANVLQLTPCTLDRVKLSSHSFASCVGYNTFVSSQHYSTLSSSQHHSTLSSSQHYSTLSSSHHYSTLSSSQGYSSCAKLPLLPPWTIQRLLPVRATLLIATSRPQNGLLGQATLMEMASKNVYGAYHDHKWTGLPKVILINL